MPSLKISPLRPYMMFTDSDGNLTKEAYDFLDGVFKRVGGSLDSLNAATLQAYTWEEPGKIGFTTPNYGRFSTLQAGDATLGGVNSSVTLSPTGSGTVTIKPSTTAGAIDNVNIGLVVPLAGVFTQVQVNGAFGCNGMPAQFPYVVGSAVSNTGATNTTPYGYTTATQANDIITKLNAVITALKNNGIIV